MESILSSSPFVAPATGPFRTLVTLEDLFNIGRCSRHSLQILDFCLTARVNADGRQLHFSLVLVASVLKEVWVSGLLNMKRCVLRNIGRFLSASSSVCSFSWWRLPDTTVGPPILVLKVSKEVWNCASASSHPSGRTVLVGSGVGVCLLEWLWDCSFSKDGPAAATVRFRLATREGVVWFLCAGSLDLSETGGFHTLF